MSVISDVMGLLPSIPVDHLALLVALCGMGLSAFALYVVHSIAKGRQA